jgi:single-strand DNA-binding protein
MLQQITLVGNLGGDPELRFTPENVAVCNFALAVNKHWLTGEGERQEKTLWFRITAWGKQAELVNQYLTKGRLAMVVGEIAEVRPYYSTSGEPAAALEVTAHTVQFLDRNQAEKGLSVGRPTQLSMLIDDEIRDLAEMDIPLFV